MVAPLVIMAAISAASAAAQLYNSEKAKGANKKRLDQIKAEFEKIVPPQYDISINQGPEYVEQAMKSANIDYRNISPEQFKVIGTYAPQAAQYVAEANPQLVQGSENQKLGRGAQIDALRQIQGIAKGSNPELDIMMQRASQNSQAQAQSRQQSVMDSSARRGLTGSGMELTSQLQGGSDAMQAGAQSSQNAAIEAYKQKLAAVQSSGQMGRQLSQDELAQEGGNVDIVNSFNQRTSRAYQDFLNQKAQMQNQAQMQNLNMQQAAADKNVSANNEADVFNLQNKNRLNQNQYDNQRQERNYQNDIATQKASWAAAEKQRQNAFKGQSYNDQLSKASGMAGISRDQNTMNTQNTQDRNAAIGGLANAAGSYYQSSANADAQKAAQDREDTRWDKYASARSGGY